MTKVSVLSRTCTPNSGIQIYSKKKRGDIDLLGPTPRRRSTTERLSIPPYSPLMIHHTYTLLRDGRDRASTRVAMPSRIFWLTSVERVSSVGGALHKNAITSGAPDFTQDTDRLFNPSTDIHDLERSSSSEYPGPRSARSLRSEMLRIR
jgi:hypothetical protein